MGLNALIEQTLIEPLSSYIPRGQNILQKVLKEYFDDFREAYEEIYSKTYGKYRIDRITEVVEEFLKCGDYKEGLRAPGLPGLNVPTQTVVMIFLFPCPARVSICAHPVIRKEHSCFQNR